MSSSINHQVYRIHVYNDPNDRYLQFMFNLSLILVFLYLLVQFIFTVQRDVEERIGEYSMGK